MAGLIGQFAMELDVDGIFVDQGAGSGVASGLRHTGFTPVLVPFGSAPSDTKYLNKRAEMWDSIKKWIKEGGALPALPEIRDELIVPQYFYGVTGKMQLERKEDMKKRGLASPDLADALGAARLIPFVFSKNEAYILEFSDRAIHFYYADAPVVLEDGTPYEIESPYKERELFGLQYSQSADVLFICHPRYPPKKLVRMGHLAWKIENLSSREGPVLLMNGSETRMRVKETKNVNSPTSNSMRFTNLGAFTFIVPEGVSQIRVQMIGGGAGYHFFKSGCLIIGGTALGDAAAIGGERDNYRLTRGGQSSFGELKVTGGYEAVPFIKHLKYSSAADACSSGANGLFIESGVVAGGGGYAGSGYGAGTGGISDGSGAIRHSVVLGGRAGGWIGGYLTVTEGEVIEGIVGSGGETNCGMQGAQGVVEISWTKPKNARVIGMLESSEDYFSDQHVGATWKLRHSIPSQCSKGLNKSGQLELEVLAHSRWYLETSGYWRGTIRVERYDELTQSWSLLRTLSSQKDRNYSESGEVEENTRVRVIGSPFVQDVPSGGDWSMAGVVTLETLPTVYDSFVKIIEYVDTRNVKVEVEKIIGSSEWTKEWTEGAWSQVHGYPGCCTFFQDRLCFGGSNSEPGTIWMSQTGDYNHFGLSLPIKDNESIIIRLVARRVGRIRSLTSLSDLIALTEAGEWKISSSKGPLGPNSVEAKPQGYRGSSELDPLLIGNRILYLREMGGAVEDLGYSFEADAYTGVDISLMAKHLIEHHKLLDWSYQQEPDSVVWIVREDGRLLGLTYLREQEIWAWHRHETEGEVESVACIPGREQDDLWLLVRRNGRLLVERMCARKTEMSNIFYLDSGVVWQSEAAEVKKIGGLDHLAEKTIGIVADGCIQPQQVVQQLEINGQKTWGIELMIPVKNVQIGLPYVSELETLNLEVQTSAGTVQGKKKKIPRVSIRVLESCGGKIGASGDGELDDLQWHTGDDYGGPMRLFSGDKTIRPPSGYNDDGRILIRQEDPLPFTLLAIIPEIVLGG